MSDSLHNHTPDTDIQQALEQVRHADDLHEDGTTVPSPLMQLAAAIPIPMPITTNPFILAFWLTQSLWWGFCSAAGKLWAFAKEHPWKSLGGMVGAGACGLLCGYFGSMVLIGELVYALKKKSQ